MPDEIIEELWRIKDEMARECGNDIRKLAVSVESKNPKDSSVATDGVRR
jgi:hypothetical protein